MTKVFVTNRGGHDHSDAERFGELIFLSEGSISRYATTQIYRQFSEKLKNSRPEDFLLPTGLTVMNLIASSIMAHMHGRINLLLYKPSNKKGGQGFYVERSLLLSELIGGGK